MISKEVVRTIDRAVKEVWLRETRQDYGSGRILREASLQACLYHHLRSRLEDTLEANSLFIYPEFYVPELKYRADLAIVETELSQGGRLSDRVSDAAAVIELKLEGGTSKGAMEAIKADLQKLKLYARRMAGCQFYFGIIYETECVWLHWLDRRSTGHWADGCVTELNAGYLDGEMVFEVNSYNHMNIQNKSRPCRMLW